MSDLDRNENIGQVKNKDKSITGKILEEVGSFHI